MEPSLKKAVIGLLLGAAMSSGWAGAQEPSKNLMTAPEVQKRLELLKSKGVETSLTILPMRLAGRPFDRLTEVVGALLEQQGLQNIELGQTPFDPGSKPDLERLSAEVGEFVKKNAITTDYALYAEYNGNMQTGLDEIHAVVVDQSGGLVYADYLGAQDEAFKQLESPDPMQLSVLLVQRLSPQFGLDEETAKSAKPGKMARLMDERSGLPPEDQRSAMPDRQKVMKTALQKATLLVFPVRISGSADAACAGDLAKMITEAQLCKATTAKPSLLLTAAQEDPNELKILWDLAREFREYVKANPISADYSLYADYAFNPENWQQGYVHFVVCDRQGEWVIVDMQNCEWEDYQSIKPTSKEACNQLLIKRLEGYLK